MNIAGVDLVNHLGSPVTQHSLGPDIEQLDDAFFVGRDDGKVLARENGVLQRACFEQCLLAFDFNTVGSGGVVEMVRAINLGHGRLCLEVIRTCLTSPAASAAG